VSWLVVTWMLAQQGPQAPAGVSAWRVIDRPDVHLGVRPAGFVDNEGEPPARPLEWGAGVTVQLTIHWPT
jgi:hypothetical protein